MRRARRGLLGLVLATGMLAATGCYHSIIETGLTPGPVGYSDDWETAWLIGAVPARVDATRACRGPWARIETQQSFLNGLVTFLTLGIYAPHEVEVTCAAGAGGGGGSARAGSEPGH